MVSDDKDYEKWVEETRKKVAVGIEQADRGQVTDGRIVIARLVDKIRKARESQSLAQLELLTGNTS